MILCRNMQGERLPRLLPIVLTRNLGIWLKYLLWLVYRVFIIVWLNSKFKHRSKLKEHMQYCVDHPEEVSKLAKVKAQVSEVKGVMMENIEKVSIQFCLVRSWKLSLDLFNILKSTSDELLYLASSCTYFSSNKMELFSILIFKAFNTF